MRFDLDPRIQGFQIPSIAEKKGVGLGVSWSSSFFLNDDLIVSDYDFYDPNVVFKSVQLKSFSDTETQLDDLSIGYSGSFHPIVNNSTGATYVTYLSATLNGNVVSTGGLPTQVWIYYGLNDGGTNRSAWSNSLDMGILDVGPLSSNISIIANTQYWYRVK